MIGKIIIKSKNNWNNNQITNGIAFRERFRMESFRNVNEVDMKIETLSIDH